MNRPETFGREPPGMTACEGRCGRELPQSEDFFDKDSSRASGFRSICKECRAADRQMAKLDEQSKTIAKLDRYLEDAMEDACPGGTNLPHIAEIYQETVSLFGGVRGVALHLVGNFMAAKPGGQVRQRILDSLLRLSESISGEGKLAPPVELMSDEDLDRELEQHKLPFRVQNGEVIDVEVEEPDVRAG